MICTTKEAVIELGYADDSLNLYRYKFFFFKQKTAYEMLRSLVGSEMCIRDRTTGVS